MLLSWHKLEENSPYDILSQLWSKISRNPCPRVCKTPEGKPFFAGNPLYFSISHSKNYGLCALAQQPIGVDIEEIRPVRQGVWQRIMTSAEQDWVSLQPNLEQACFQIWTRKEAYVKYTGQGFDGFPHKIDTILLGNLVSFRTFYDENRVISICTKSPDTIHIQNPTAAMENI